ncbi:MAG: thiamine diphosphokinase [Granulosicoccus sp.]
MSLKKKRRALVFASGDFSVQMLAGLSPEPGDVVVCVDGGLVHCLKTGWSPTLLLGDMDSVPAGLLKRSDIASVEIQRHPVGKDASDLELALLWLTEQAVSEVILTGISGRRTDHMLFNWLLVAQREWPFRLRMLDESTNAVLVTPVFPLRLSVKPGQIVSLLALRTVSHLTTTGLQYALSDAKLERGSTRGLSNVVLESTIGLRIADGALLVLLIR